MKKKLLAILLTACMVLSMAPAALAADSVFTDVNAGDWFAEEVEYVYDNGLMNGVGDNKFDPNGNVTRAMMWTTLARIAGENTTGSDPWWLAGQQWAMMTGVSDGTMATDNITREQLVTMLYRYAQLKGYDVSVGENTNILSYTDAFDVNEWAIPAMQWACGAGIINGIDGALQPQGYATRAQLAAILYRFVEEVVDAAPATYTVTFMWNYGDKGVYETVEVEDGETVGSMKNPSRGGYSFSGWYTEDGDRFTLNTKVTEDIVVYAKWSRDVYIPSHIHSYKNWSANGDGTHTGICSCGDTVTDSCNIGADEVCAKCGAAYPTTATTLQDALNKGGLVILSEDVTVTETLIVPDGVEVTLDLNGNTIASGYQEGSAEKHIYALQNKGVLIITDSKDTGSISGRGIYNGVDGADNTGVVLTIDGATVVAEDWNGGACVWSYGGEVYLNDAVMTGNTGVVSSQSYLEINGGTYTCYSGINDEGSIVASPTYNIRAYDGLKITDGTFTSRHGVISVAGGDAVIEDGSYTIQFAAQTTSNVVYVYGDADLTINGGEFISDNSANKADSGAAVLVSGNDALLTVNDGTFVGMNGMVSGNVNTELRGGTYNTVWNYNHYDNIKNFIPEDCKAEQNAETGAWTVRELTVVDGVIYDGDTLYGFTSDFTGTTLTVKNGTTALRGGVFAGMDITTVTIPATVTDFGATGVTAENASGGAFKGSAVTTVVLEEGMTEIPAAAFNGATQLTAVTIPASVETIGIHAFRQTAMTNLTIPATVTTIGFGAFRDMPNLTTVTVEGDALISSFAFRSCPKLETVYLNGENVTFQSGKMIFSHADTGANDGITVYVANADVEAALNAVQKEDDGFKIVVLKAMIGDTVYEDLQAALDKVSETKGTVVLAADVEMEAATTAPYGNKYALKMAGGTLDGAGHELYMECYGDDYGIMTSGGTVKNLTIEEGCRAIMIMYPTEDIILDNVNIGGNGVLYPINTGEAGSKGVELIVSNSTIKGWTSFSNIESASFTNCEFGQGTYYDNIYGRVLKPYVNTMITDCSFIEHMNLDLSGLAEGQKVTIKNCTVAGQAVTASVFTVPETDNQYDTELFTVDLPSWADSLADVLIIDGKIPVADGIAQDAESGEYEITSAAGLFNFAEQVNDEHNNFSGKTVKLVADIDLENAAWTPIGQTGSTEFRGTFDGGNYTISNLNVDSSAQTGANYSSGLFGWSEAGATIKNVKIDGATVKGNHNVAVIVGYTYSNVITNCHVSNAMIVCAHSNDDACGDKAGIIGGYVGDEARVTDCSASDCTVTAGRDAGQLIGCGYNVSLSNCSADNVTVTAGGNCTGANINEALIGRVLG